MEIIAIEKKTFERMIQSFEDFAGQVKVLCEKNRSNEQWLDKAVCRLLHISKRTLQEWRSKQVMPFIKLKGKILYRQRDIKKVLAEHCVIVR